MVKPDKLTQLKVHTELSHNGHPVDGALLGAGSLWLCLALKCTWPVYYPPLVCA
jgi:hypothetical protein